jgi:hypothetical protein
MENAMRKEEPSPPEPDQSAIFYLGRDSRGSWVAQDADHLRGGLFVSRAAALKFALFENGNQPDAVVTVPGIIELDFGSRPMRAEAVTGPFRKAA